jgi:hypothetical protein
LVLQEPADVPPPAANTTVPNATSLETVNPTSPVSLVNQSMGSTSEGPAVITESGPALQDQNVTEPESVIDNQTEPQKTSEIPENIADSEESQ